MDSFQISGPVLNFLSFAKFRTTNYGLQILSQIFYMKKTSCLMNETSYWFNLILYNPTFLENWLLIFLEKFQDILEDIGNKATGDMCHKTYYGRN